MFPVELAQRHGLYRKRDLPTRYFPDACEHGEIRMRINRTSGLKTLLSLLAIAVLLVGCSRINLAYRNLDLLASWTLNDHLELNRSQQSRLREQLREHLAWHCRTQLPHDLDTLERMRQQIRQGQFDEQAIGGHYGHIRQALHAVAVEITPTAVQLLRELDDRQVSQFAEALARDHREQQDTYLAAPLPQQIRERAERMGKRVKQWTGSLNAAQQQRILAWAQALDGQNRLWLQNRRQWQTTLLQALDERHGAAFEQRIITLLQERETIGTDAYRAALARNERATITLLSDLYALADQQQRRQLDDRLGRLSEDLASLDCLPDAL